MNTIAELSIDTSRFDNPEQIDSRVEIAPDEDQASLRSALAYLYLSDGPTDLARSRLKLAEGYLESAERIVIRWLQTRTNGRLGKHFGRNSLLAARSARYRCQSCGFADVRVLNLDHAHGRKSDSDEFVCLCANCHLIKARVRDWELPTDA